MVVTAWRDLGKCENCFDPNFIKHFEEFNHGKPLVSQNEPDSKNIFCSDGIGEWCMLADAAKKFEDDADDKWTDIWIQELQDLGLWDEMRRYEKYERGERPWHEQDGIELLKRKQKRETKVPRLRQVLDLDIGYTNLAHSLPQATDL
jgi:hypothetical protein